MKKFPTLPGIAIKILEAVKDEKTRLNDIVDILSKDSSLSAEILEAINSPFYGLTSKVTSVSPAVNILEIVRHEAAQKMRVWPLGVGLQEQAPKHLKLLWSKAKVVSVEGKVPPDAISAESERRAQANHSMRCRKLKDDVKTGGYLYTTISPQDTCVLSGRRPA